MSKRVREMLEHHLLTNGGQIWEFSSPEKVYDKLNDLEADLDTLIHQLVSENDALVKAIHDRLQTEAINEAKRAKQLEKLLLERESQWKARNKRLHDSIKERDKEIAELKREIQRLEEELTKNPSAPAAGTLFGQFMNPVPAHSTDEVLWLRSIVERMLCEHK